MPTITDSFVKLRESVLAVVLAIYSTDVLNSQPLPDIQLPNVRSVAAEVKGAVNALKAIAMDEKGEHVDYGSLARSDVYHQFRSMCTPRLRTFDPSHLSNQSERLAFWINLYNALVIDAVIRFNVKTSVTEGPVGILRFFRQAAYNVCGHRLTCEDIEHGILRGNRGNPYLPGPQFGPNDQRLQWVLDPVDPRIHFALNCASKSCPPIGVYNPENIDLQLDLAAQNFIFQETSILPGENTIHISKIFQWYEKDFGGKHGVIDFLLKYLPEGESQSWLAKNRTSANIKYQPYDWNLNI